MSKWNRNFYNPVSLAVLRQSQTEPQTLAVEPELLHCSELEPNSKAIFEREANLNRKNQAVRLPAPDIRSRILKWQ